MNDIKDTYVGVRGREMVEIGSVAYAEDGYFDGLVKDGISIICISHEELEGLKVRMLKEVTIRLDQRPVCEFAYPDRWMPIPPLPTQQETEE